MSDKRLPTEKPYIYAFSSGRLVLLVCIVLALMALSLMLGIRIERYQVSRGVAGIDQSYQSGSKGLPEPVRISQKFPSPLQAEDALKPQEGDGEEKTGDAPVEEPPAKIEIVPDKPVTAPPTLSAEEPAEPPVELKAETPAPGPQPRKPEPAPGPIKEAPKGHYAVQVSSSRDRGMAVSRVDMLKKNGFDAYIEEIKIEGKGLFYRVLAGPFQTRDEAESVRKKLARDLSFKDCYVRYLP